MNTVGSKLGGYILLMLFQLIFVVVYGIFVRYEDRLLPQSKDATATDAPKSRHVASYAREYETTKKHMRRHIFCFIPFRCLVEVVVARTQRP